MPIAKYDSAKGTRWRVRYTTPAGKYTDKRGFATKREAELWEAENVLSISRGTYISPNSGRVRFGALLDEFISLTGSLAPTTVATRVSVARTWVAPHWDGWRMEDITPAAIHDWLDQIRRDGASEPVVEKAYRVLNGVMQRAVDRRVLAVNPTPRLRLQKKVEKKRNSLTNQQVIELAHHIDSRYRLLIGVLAYTGLRFGEAAALRAEDVHIGRRRIDVRHAVAEVHGHVVEGAPKGGRARAVPIPDFLLADLAQVVAVRKPSDLMFPAPQGGFLHLTTWRRRVFYPALEALSADRRNRRLADIPEVTPHDLRHTAASLAVQVGANVKVLQRMMGHSAASLTLDVYADMYESDLDEVSARMSKLVRNEKDLPWG